jgi:hypothetical protein
MLVISFTPRPLYPQGKSHLYPFDRRLSGPQSLSGRGGEEKDSQPQPGIEKRKDFCKYMMMSMCKEKANSYPHNTFCICSDGTELGQNPKEHLGKKSG